jgi:hypothetical protein
MLTVRSECLPVPVASNGLIMNPLDRRRMNIKQWNYNWQRWNACRKACPTLTLASSNSTWTGLALKPWLRDEKPTANLMSHGTIRTGNMNLNVAIYCKFAWRFVNIFTVIFIVSPDALQVAYVTSMPSTHQAGVSLYVKLSVILV